MLFAKLVAHNKLDREQSKAFLAKDAALFKVWDEYRAEKEAGLNPLPYDLLKKIQKLSSSLLLPRKQEMMKESSPVRTRKNQKMILMMMMKWTSWMKTMKTRDHSRI